MATLSYKTIARINKRFTAEDKQVKEAKRKQKEIKPKAKPQPIRETSRRCGVRKEEVFKCRKTELMFRRQIGEVLDWLSKCYHITGEDVQYRQEKETNQFVVNICSITIPQITRIELLKLIDFAYLADVAISICGATKNRIKINLIDKTPVRNGEI